ncbi:MAG: DMT family transporter, partial [Eubacteriales bacterium]|nr:DMT family transporter [Eubacteriales bacterium]
IAFAFAGSVLIAFADSMHAGGRLYGDVLALAAAVAVAAYVLLGKVVRRSVSTTAYTYVVYAACALALVLITGMQGQSLTGHGPSAVVVGLLLAVFSTILGHSIFSWCLKYFSPSFVSASKLCEPVVASLLAAILFAEAPSLLQAAGGVLIIGSVLYYSRIENAQKRE